MLSYGDFSRIFAYKIYNNKKKLNILNIFYLIVSKIFLYPKTKFLFLKIKISIKKFRLFKKNNISHLNII